MPIVAIRRSRRRFVRTRPAMAVARRNAGAESLSTGEKLLPLFENVGFTESASSFTLVSAI